MTPTVRGDCQEPVSAVLCARQRPYPRVVSRIVVAEDDPKQAELIRR
jgi:hypothetical protein